MRLPSRSIKSIQSLPSIYTTFPANYDNPHTSSLSGLNSGTCLIRQIEDGIEVVPFERCNILSAPILSPDQEEKEVFVMSQKEIDIPEKPLPNLPRCIWQRMSLRQRILALLGIQFLMLMTVGLALMAVKGPSSQGDPPSRVRATGGDSPHTDPTDPIQRGIFAIPVQLPQQQSSACLARMNESVAWQCASDTTFQLNILPSPADDNDTKMITLGPPLSNGSISYGHQVPEIRPIQLIELGDAAPDDGPAYHFRTTYDRVVLLTEGDLTPAEKPKTQSVSQHPTFQSGESIWRCVFNETLIEGYLYVNQPTTPEVTNTESTIVNASTAARVPKVPYVLKLVEERMPNGKVPYCEKMMAQKEGILASRSGKISLSLSEPASKLLARTNLIESARFRRRQQAQSANYCRCQWLIQ